MKQEIKNIIIIKFFMVELFWFKNDIEYFVIKDFKELILSILFILWSFDLQMMLNWEERLFLKNNFQVEKNQFI